MLLAVDEGYVSSGVRRIHCVVFDMYYVVYSANDVLFSH